MSDKPIYSAIFPSDKTPMPKPGPKQLFKRPIMERFSMKGKICVVTGAARDRGIGYAAAAAYAEAGATGLALWDWNDPSDAAAALAKKYPETVVKAYRVDISADANVKEVLAATVKDFGTVDVFVANAGVIWGGGSILNPENDDNKEWKRLMDVDLNGVYYCAKNVGRIFKEKRGGAMVITASMSGLIVNIPYLQTPYNVAKAACIHMTHSLAVEFAEFGARINCVCPGYIDTGFGDFVSKETLDTWCSMIPAERQGDNSELAGAYLYLGSDASSYTNGAALVVDGAYCCP